MVEAVASHFPRGYAFGQVERLLPTVDPSLNWVEIEQVEEVRDPLPFVEIADYYYLIHPYAGDGSGWSQIFRALLGLQAPGQLSVVLMPTMMTQLERESIDRVCSATSYYANTWTDYDFYNNPQTMPPDAGAQATLASWQRYNYSHGLLAHVVIGTQTGEAERLASTVGGLLANKTHGTGTDNRFEVIHALSPSEVFYSVEMGVVTPRYRNPVWTRDDSPITLERMPYFLSEEEAGGLLFLPVPTERGCLGFPESRSVDEVTPPLPASATGRALQLGQAAGSGQPVSLSVDRLTSHIVVGGRTRSGKTTTVHSMLARLWTEHQVPWLVIEPRGTPDYRNLLALKGMDKLQVFKLGTDEVAPLRLNPLEIPPGRSVDQHVASVLESFQAAVSLFEPLPELLEETLHEVYATYQSGEPWPTTFDLLREFTTVWERYPFKGDAAGMVHSMRLRLKRLTQGNIGNVLATSESNDWQMILSRPTVFELSTMSGEQQQLVTTFAVQQVLAAAAHRGPNPKLRHVLVLEEAHNLLAAPTGGLADDPRNRAVERLVNAIAELGATGQGFCVVDQRPGALHPAVVANSATKIIHRQESATERDALMADIGATEAEATAARELATGEAIVKLPDHHRPVVTRVVPLEGVNTIAPMTDERVRTAMAGERAQTVALLPTTLCSREICASGCDPSRRATGAANARTLLRKAGLGLADAATSTASSSAKLADQYCGLMQFELEAATLAGQPEQIRARLLRELNKVTQ